MAKQQTVILFLVIQFRIDKSNKYPRHYLRSDCLGVFTTIILR